MGEVLIGGGIVHFLQLVCRSLWQRLGKSAMVAAENRWTAVRRVKEGARENRHLKDFSGSAPGHVMAFQ